MPDEEQVKDDDKNQEDLDFIASETGFIDPLTQCLVILTKLNDRPFSVQSLVTGLPLQHNCLTPHLFPRAAQRAGFSARVVKRKLKEISPLVLPAILLLNNNQACVLTKITKEGFDVILPESEEGHQSFTAEELQEQYTGFSIFAKPIYRFDKRADEQNLKKPYSWFWGTLWQYRRNFYQVIVAAILINLFALASPLFVMNVYDRVVPNNAIETLWVLAIGITIIFLFDFLLRTLRGYIIDISGRKADTIIASLLMQQLLNIRMEAKPLSAGGFSNNLHGYEALRSFFTSATIVTLVDLPFIFLFLFVIWSIGGYVVLIPLIAVPVVIIAGIFLEIPMRRAVEEGFFGATQKHALLVEAVSNLETIKTQSTASQIQRKWEQYVSMVARSGLKSNFFSTLALNITTYTMQMVTVGVVIVGVYLISMGDLSMGGLIASTILSGRSLAPLSQIAGLITRFQQSKMGLDGLNKIMELPIERPDEKRFLHRPELTGNIEFNGVDFHFPGQMVNAINQITFTIKPGEKVALLGRIGSGKSTILKLIVGLYQALEGTIRLDEVDIGQIDPADIRKNIGYVGQDPALFFGTVRENITSAMPWANDLNILRAAKIASVDEFVRRHPAGYDMPIGERGEGLSGGQRQAITIARALLPNPNILLLDEPTSAMDNSAEVSLINNLRTIYKEKTLILVTHKPQMLTLVDRIIIIDNGKIVADGPKSHVLDKLSNRKVKSTKS